MFEMVRILGIISIERTVRDKSHDDGFRKVARDGEREREREKKKIYIFCKKHCCYIPKKDAIPIIVG
jgi:hypothetical protein